MADLQAVRYRLKSWCGWWLSLVNLADPASPAHKRVKFVRSADAACLVTVTEEFESIYCIHVCNEASSDCTVLVCNGPQVTTSDNLTLAESFQFQYDEYGRVTLRGLSCGGYLTSDARGRVWAGTATARSWERFHLMPYFAPQPTLQLALKRELAPLRVNLRAHTGLYVCSSSSLASAHSEVPCCCEEVLVDLPPLSSILRARDGPTTYRPRPCSPPSALPLGPNSDSSFAHPRGSSPPGTSGPDSDSSSTSSSNSSSGSNNSGGSSSGSGNGGSSSSNGGCSGGGSSRCKGNRQEWGCKRATPALEEGHLQRAPPSPQGIDVPSGGQHQGGLAHASIGDVSPDPSNSTAAAAAGAHVAPPAASSRSGLLAGGRGASEDDRSVKERAGLTDGGDGGGAWASLLRTPDGRHMLSARGDGRLGVVSITEARGSELFALALAPSSSPSQHPLPPARLAHRPSLVTIRHVPAPAPAPGPPAALPPAPVPAPANVATRQHGAGRGAPHEGGGGATWRQYAGMYVSAEPSGRLVCNRPRARGWEFFPLELASGSKVLIQSFQGGFLSAAPICRPQRGGAWRGPSGSSNSNGNNSDGNEGRSSGNGSGNDVNANNFAGLRNLPATVQRAAAGGGGGGGGGARAGAEPGAGAGAASSSRTRRSLSCGPRAAGDATRGAQAWQIRAHGDGLYTLLAVPTAAREADVYLCVDCHGGVFQSSEPRVSFPASASLFEVKPVAYRSLLQLQGGGAPCQLAESDAIAGFTLLPALLVAGKRRYLSVEPSGRISASRVTPSASEVFALIDVPAAATSYNLLASQEKAAALSPSDYCDLTSPAAPCATSASPSPSWTAFRPLALPGGIHPLPGLRELLDSALAQPPRQPRAQVAAAGILDWGAADVAPDVGHPLPRGRTPGGVLARARARAAADNAAAASAALVVKSVGDTVKALQLGAAVPGRQVATLQALCIDTICAHYAATSGPRKKPPCRLRFSAGRISWARAPAPGGSEPQGAKLLATLCSLAPPDGPAPAGGTTPGNRISSLALLHSVPDDLLQHLWTAWCSLQHPRHGCKKLRPGLLEAVFDHLPGGGGGGGGGAPRPEELARARRAFAQVVPMQCATCGARDVLHLAPQFNPAHHRFLELQRRQNRGPLLSPTLWGMVTAGSAGWVVALLCRFVLDAVEFVATGDLPHAPAGDSGTGVVFYMPGHGGM